MPWPGTPWPKCPTRSCSRDSYPARMPRRSPNWSNDTRPWYGAPVRRVLSDVHLAEDAFQATFVTLARKARTLRQPERLPGWLYGVARRAAWQRRSAVRQPATSDVPDVPSRAASPLEQISGKELIAAIEAEVDQLSEEYRSAIILCWFQDCSLEDAARQLGTTRGTLWGWLKRARERLQRRLAGRGYGLPAVFGAGLIAGIPASAQLVKRAVEIALQSPAASAVVGASAGLHPALKPVGLAALVASAIVGFVTLLPAGAPDTPPVKEAPRKDAEPKTEQADRTADGFPLPAGAIYRFGNRQLRHADGISASAMSPDGKSLATIGQASVVVWDLETLTARRVLSGSYFGSYGYGDRSAGLAFLPDSKSLLVTVRPTDQTSINVNEMVELAQSVGPRDRGKRELGLKGPWHWISAAWPVDGGKEIALLSGYHEAATIQYFAAADGKELRRGQDPAHESRVVARPGCEPDRRALGVERRNGRIGCTQRRSSL